MALKFAPGVARLAFVGTYQGSNWANVFHWWNGTDDAFLQTDIDDLVTDARTLYATHLLGRMSNQVTLTSVTGTDLTNILGVVAVDSTATAGALNSTQWMPSNVACVISWKTARHYRGGHGRTYLTGQPRESLQTSRTWTAAHTAATNASASAFRAGMNTIATPTYSSGGRFVTLHRIVGGVEIDPPITSVVVGNTVDSRVDSMRSRLGPDTSA